MERVELRKKSTDWLSGDSPSLTYFLINFAMVCAELYFAGCHGGVMHPEDNTFDNRMKSQN